MALISSYITALLLWRKCLLLISSQANPKSFLRAGSFLPRLATCAEGASNFIRVKSPGVTKPHHFVTPGGAATKPFLSAFMALRGSSAYDLFILSLFNLVCDPDTLLIA